MVYALPKENTIINKPRVPDKDFKPFTNSGFTFLVEYFSSIDVNPLVKDEERARIMDNISIVLGNTSL